MKGYSLFCQRFRFYPPPILPDVFLVKWGILFLKKADAVRDLLSRINPEEILRMYEETVDTMKRNRVFREGTIEGYVIAVIDGMKLFSSTKKNVLSACSGKTSQDRQNAFTGTWYA